MPPSKCDECGLDYSALLPGDISAALRSYERRYRAPLTRFLPGEDGEALLRRRPAAGGWSALEYAAHVRNSFLLECTTLRRILAEDGPTLPSVDPDEEAVARDFNGEAPADVVAGLAAAIADLAGLVDSMEAEAWNRTASIPGLGEVDAMWLARNAVHEGHHHLLDVGRVMRAAREEARR